MSPTRSRVSRRVMQERCALELAELHLLPSAPRAVIDAAYRALSRIYHPDLQGNDEAQQRINQAYQKIITQHADPTD